MFRPEKFDEIVQQFTRLLPEDMQQARADIQKNMKSALSATLARMDLVTREEFDVQTALLARTRALLEEMEAKLGKLEAELEKKKTG
jgi:ubiquinone biosynthesis accessory factor UbiK